MGLVIDTRYIISQERAGQSISTLIQNLRALPLSDSLVISSITVLELSHGIHRARDYAISQRRQAFLNDLCDVFVVHPVTVDVAKLTGRIDGEQAALGYKIDLADLLIGSTALALNHSILTLNPNHFRLIPGLSVLTP